VKSLGHDSGAPRAGTLTRRQMIVAGVLAAGGWAAGRARAQSAAPASPPDPARTSLHYEARFGVSPQRIYSLLLDSAEFAAMTKRPATIDPAVGGAFSMFGGVIVGRNVELLPGKRIVQAWRPTHWEPGFYSMVRFELDGAESRAELLLDHWGFPAGDADSLDSGWQSHYLVPMSAYLGGPPG
jgi:activator of HSP90 ATPase